MRKKALAWSMGIGIAVSLVAAPAMATYDYPLQNTSSGTKRLPDIKLSTNSKTFATGYMTTGCGNFSGRLRKNNGLSPDTTISSFSGSGCNISYFDPNDHSVSASNTYHGDFTYGTSGKKFQETIVQN